MPKGIYPRTATMNTGKYVRTPWHCQLISERNGMRGKHHTEETLQKMSKSHSGSKNQFYGKQHSEETRQLLSELALSRRASGEHILSFAGHHHTEEAKRRIGEAFKGRFVGEKNGMFGRVGNLNPNWQGGIAHLPYSWNFNMRFKEYIRQRDNYTCQRCGVPQCECLRKLSVHHIDYTKENTEETNAISLCGKCNAQVNFDRGYWQSYFEQKIAEIYVQKEVMIQWQELSSSQLTE